MELEAGSREKKKKREEGENQKIGARGWFPFEGWFVVKRLVGTKVLRGVERKGGGVLALGANRSVRCGESFRGAPPMS